MLVTAVGLVKDTAVVLKVVAACAALVTQQLYVSHCLLFNNAVATSTRVYVR